MNSRTLRGVSEIVGNVLMLLVVTGLIAEAFLYGMPILRKRMDQATVSYVENALGEVADAMEATSNSGGNTRVYLEKGGTFSTPPEIKITHDSLGYYLEVRSAAQIAYYAPFDVPLNDFIEPVKDGELILGTQGVNKGVVVTGRSTKLSGGVRNVIILRPRPIRDSGGSDITLIELEPAPGKSTKTTLSTNVYISKYKDTTEPRLENNQTVMYRIIGLHVGFE